MNFKLIGIITLILFLSLTVFAGNPVITGPNIATREYSVTGDRNYYDFNVIWYSGIITDTDGDLNIISCEMSNNGGFTWYSTTPTVDLNLSPDGNRCKTNLNYEWGNTNDVNINFRVSDDSPDRNTTTGTTWNTWWLDNTAPETLGTSNTTSVTLTSTDDATTAGNGVGVKRIYYKLDDANWTSSTSNPLTLTPGLGNHTILFYAVDNFDNNEMTENSGSPRSKPFYVGTVTNQSCGLLNLLTLLIAAIIVITILVMGLTGNLDLKIVIALIVMAVAGVIAIVILGSFLVPFCGLP